MSDLETATSLLGRQIRSLLDMFGGAFVLTSTPPGLTERAVKARAVSTLPPSAVQVPASPLVRRYRVRHDRELIVRREPAVSSAPESMIGLLHSRSVHSFVRMEGEFVKLEPAECGEALRGTQYFNPTHDPATEGWVRCRDGSNIFLLPESDATCSIESWSESSGIAGASAAALSGAHAAADGDAEEDADEEEEEEEEEDGEAELEEEEEVDADLAEALRRSLAASE